MKTETVKTVSDIFACWQTIPEMASDVGESPWTVSKWKQRGRIPQTSWTAVAAAVHGKGKNLSTDQLLAMHSPRRRGMRSTASACQ